MNFRTALIPLIAALAFLPALAQATALSDLTAATATNTIDNGNNEQEWDWSTLSHYGLYLNTNGTAAGNDQELLRVYSQGANSTSGRGTVAAEIINEHSGTNSINYGLVVQADSGTSHNYGIVGYTMGTSAGDYGVLGDSTATSGANYGLYGLDNSPTGYAGYFDNTNGGYAAAFIGGNVGIGTATPQSLVHAYGGEVQVGSSGASCASAIGGAIRFSGSALYYCDGTSTWQTVSTGSGSSQWTTSGSNIYYTTGNVGIGISAPGSKLEADGWISTQNYVTIDTNANAGITWDPTGGTPSNYAIYRGAGAWSGNYQQLQLHWITGIVIDGGTSYGKSGTVLQPNGGDVGIGNSSPSYTLQVNGSVAGTSAYVNTSDIRLKKNIQPLDVGLKTVEQLKPVTFEWKDGAFKQWTSSGPADPRMPLREDRRPHDPAMQGKQIGFIAQDVEKILPSVVVTEANAEKTKGMKYSELIPVLVKAMQEQQAQLAKDEAALTKDEATIAAMKAKLGM